MPRTEIAQRLRSRLSFAPLEDRTVPNAVAPTIDRGATYQADGETIRLLERIGQYVVRIDGADQQVQLSALTSKGLMAGFQINRWLASSTYIVTDPTNRGIAGPLPGGVTWIAPLLRTIALTRIWR